MPYLQTRIKLLNLIKLRLKNARILGYLLPKLNSLQGIIGRDFDPPNTLQPHSTTLKVVDRRLTTCTAAAWALSALPREEWSAASAETSYCVAGSWLWYLAGCKRDTKAAFCVHFTAWCGCTLQQYVLCSNTNRQRQL